MADDDGDEVEATAIGPSLPPHLAVKRAVIGPTMPPPPPNSDAEAIDPPPSTTTSTRRVMGPTMPPRLNNDNEPKLSAAAQAFLEREKRMKEASDRQDAGLPPLLEEKSNRPDWMLALPTSQSFSQSLQKDPLAALKNRGFSQAQNARVQRGRGGAGLGGTEEEDTSLWTETPQEREKRLLEEEMGVRPKASEKGHIEGKEEQEKRMVEQEREEILQRAIQEHNDQRGPTLLEQHQAKRRSEMKDKDRKRDKSNGSRSHRRRDDSESDSEGRDRKCRRREEHGKYRRRERFELQSDSETLSENERRRERRRERHSKEDEKEERERNKTKHGKHHHHNHSHRSESRERERELRRKEKEKEREKKLKRKDREREEKEEKKGAPMMVWDREAAMSMGGKLLDNQKRMEKIRSAADLGNRFGSGTIRYL